MYNCGIYKITNIINEKFYIGSSNKIKYRLNRHKAKLKKNTHDNIHLQQSCNKHGLYAFTFEVVLYCEEKDLLFYEQRFIDKYWDHGETCYNIAKNVTAPMTGLKLSEEAKKKLSDSLTGKKRAPFTDEAKANMSAVRKGKNKSSETKENMKRAWILRREKLKQNPHKQSEETKEKKRKAVLLRNRDSKGRLIK